MDWQSIAQTLQDSSLQVIQDPQQVAKLSQDYFHFSPVLQEKLGDCRGDLVVRARSEADVLTVAQLCVREQIPLTLRGAGTGNYGQCIPLRGGIILDLSGLNRILRLEPGLALAEAGVKMGALERQAQTLGWELRMAPSTYRTATLGGFISGGSVGMGSINYGLISDAGNVRSLRLVTLEDPPQILTLRGEEIQAVLHAYGVNGAITQVELPLAPLFPWAESIIAFPDLKPAAEFAQALSLSSGIVKKQIAVQADPIPRYFSALQNYLPEGQAVVFTITSDWDRPALVSLIRQHGGTLTDYQLQSGAQCRGLVEFCWNHTTLLARAVDPTLTYLQVFYGDLERVLRLQAQLGEEVMIHLEWLRVGGNPTPAGLPLVRYQSAERLGEIIRLHQEAGAVVANPHAYTLEGGGTGPLKPALLDLKRRADPFNLLNPGKIEALL
ncbi:MAG: FAD-binding oxidoreductase [Cyanobacteriota bacterium]|jgi:FAD/FMN-containing dehydrogenase